MFKYTGIDLRNPPRTNVEDGVHYIIHYTADENIEDACFQRKYSFKFGRSQTKYDEWGWKLKNKKARKRTNLKASIKDALKEY